MNNKYKFKKGDRIISIKKRDSAAIGMIGTIILLPIEGDYGVEFDLPFKNGHFLEHIRTGKTHAKSKRGYWVKEDEIELYINYTKKDDIKCMTCFKEFKGKDVKKQKCPYCKSNTIIKIENV